MGLNDIKVGDLFLKRSGFEWYCAIIDTVEIPDYPTHPGFFKVWSNFWIKKNNPVGIIDPLRITKRIYLSAKEIDKPLYVYKTYCVVERDSDFTILDREKYITGMCKFLTLKGV